LESRFTTTQLITNSEEKPALFSSMHLPLSTTLEEKKAKGEFLMKLKVKKRKSIL